MGQMEYMRMIRNLREDADKTQAQIAHVLGTSQTMYARYERGASEMPIRHLITLCRYYGVSADYVLGLKQKNKSRRTRRTAAGICFFYFMRCGGKAPFSR